MVLARRVKKETVKKLIPLCAGLGLLGGLSVGMASADEHIPPHGHMLIQGVEEGPEGPTYRKCVDLANNQALSLHSHHEKVHFGRAGEALGENAGHAVVPTAPFSPFRDCAHIAELFGPPTK